jgi:hypothetical protein
MLKALRPATQTLRLAATARSAFVQPSTRFIRQRFASSQFLREFSTLVAIQKADMSLWTTAKAYTEDHEWIAYDSSSVCRFPAVIRNPHGHAGPGHNDPDTVLRCLFDLDTTENWNCWYYGICAEGAWRRRVCRAPEPR